MHLRQNHLMLTTLQSWLTIQQSAVLSQHFLPTIACKDEIVAQCYSTYLGRFPEGCQLDLGQRNVSPNRVLLATLV